MDGLAFWEDRYHATAVEHDEHLARCMLYIDMNMARAGVVKNPEDRPFCGYNEVRKRDRTWTSDLIVASYSRTDSNLLSVKKMLISENR